MSGDDVMQRDPVSGLEVELAWLDGDGVITSLRLSDEPGGGARLSWRAPPPTQSVTFALRGTEPA
jgi:hypothetical protein